MSPLLQAAAASLELQYRFDRFAAFPELAGSKVNSIASQDNGAVWVGAQDGLFHFDGARVTAYRADTSEGSLRDSHVLSLLIDRRGRLWVGTMQGLDQFDPASALFVARQARAGQEWLAGLPVLSLLEAPDGSIWAGTADSGLYHLSPGGELLEHYDSLDRGGVLSSPDVWDLAVDGESGHLWLATEGGLDRLDPATGTVDQRRVPPGDEQTLRQRRTITSIQVDRSGDLWLTSLAGAWRFDRETGRFESLAGWSEALAGPQMQVLQVGAQGLWFASLESGVVHCPDRDSACRQLVHEAASPHSLPTNAVRRIHRDRQGRLWLATNDGLARFDPKRLQWGHYRFAGLDGEHPEVWALVRWHDELYLGTFGQGLWRADWQALKSHASRVPVERVPLAHDTPWSLMVDSRNRLWVSTFGGGLFRFDAPGAEPRHWLHDPDDADSISFNHVWHLSEDDAGLWAGTYGAGLDLLDADSGRRLGNWFPGSEASISSRRVPLVLRDSQDRLWAGSYGGGLNRWRPQTRDFEAWRHDPADPASLPHDFIADLAEGPEGRLWIPAVDRLLTT